MEITILVITSIANQHSAVLKAIAKGALANRIPFVLIGDEKSPQELSLNGCDYYNIDTQEKLNFELAEITPKNHYSRKNLGYLIAMARGANIIIETDDDNIPLKDFWKKRAKGFNAHILFDKGWVNVYKYFTDVHVWPRGFALDHIQDRLPKLEHQNIVLCPIQQGLANENPDVDAIYRLTQDLPIQFKHSNPIALGKNSICPFNSQNTTWFKEAFALLYLPSYCSFRMTDIWRSFIAQRIAWTCDWYILFHDYTVVQKRNFHNLMHDFNDEISGYTYNSKIMNSLLALDLNRGKEYIPNNMKICYNKLIELGLVDKKELFLLDAWLHDIENL